MKRKKVKLCVCLLVFGLTGLQAQESVNATGGNASGSGGSASYSVGQVTYQTHSGANGSVAEGVQQPFEISVVTGLEEVDGINLELSAYPNPVNDNLTLEVVNFHLTSFTFQLFDMNGKLLQSEIIAGNQTSITMSNLAPATYFLKVTEGNKEVKTFKIVKR
jgi:hypothetical protein